MNKNKKLNVKYTYCGRRVSPLGEVYQTFIVNGDLKKEAHFSKIKGVVIGQTYLGSDSSMPVRPESVECWTSLSEKEMDLFNAHDMAAQEAIRDRRERNLREKTIAELSRSKKIISLKKQIEEVAAGLNTVQKQYFINALCRWRKK